MSFLLSVSCLSGTTFSQNSPSPLVTGVPDALIYNDPFAYAELVLCGDVKEYLDTVRQGQ